ncbi:NAD-glutamate dehydrogenase domain-containing protein, partial [Dactylosporangium aurantiacum]
GRIATDFIDNSAGVDCSDHEVNIKILLDRAVADGALRPKDRNPLLAQMTDEVAELVLRDNYDQATTLGDGRAQSRSLLPVHKRLIADLERRGQLDRAQEGLPTDEELDARAADGVGLTSPEFAVLLSYAKIGLEREILDSGVPDEVWTDQVLVGYFPTPLRERFVQAMAEHPLRREIVTTAVVNEAVNWGGASFFHRAAEETGAGAADILRASVVVRDVYGLAGLRRAGESLDNQVPAAAQTEVNLKTSQLLDRAVRWLVSNRRLPIDVPGEIARLRPGISRLLPRLETLLCGQEREALHTDAAALRGLGLPAEIADRTIRIVYGFGLLDIVEVASRTGQDVNDVAAVYYALSERFRVHDLLSRIADLPREDRWQTLARMALRYDLYAALAALTAEVLTATPPGDDAADRVHEWEQSNAALMARTRNAIGEFGESPGDLAAISVLLRQIRTLVRTSAA